MTRKSHNRSVDIKERLCLEIVNSRSPPRKRPGARYLL